MSEKLSIIQHTRKNKSRPPYQTVMKQRKEITEMIEDLRKKSTVPAIIVHLLYYYITIQSMFPTIMGNGEYHYDRGDINVIQYNQTK